MKDSFNDLFNTNPKVSTTAGFILGMILIDGLTAFEQNMLGNWIILVGQTVLTNASSQNLIEGRIAGHIININSKETKCIYNPLIYDIEKIRKIISELYPDNDNALNAIKKSVDSLQEQINKLKEK